MSAHGSFLHFLPFGTLTACDNSSFLSLFSSSSEYGLFASLLNFGLLFGHEKMNDT